MHTPAVHYAIEELKPKDDEVGSPTGAMVEKVADPESRVQPRAKPLEPSESSYLGIRVGDMPQREISVPEPRRGGGII